VTVEAGTLTLVTVSCGKRSHSRRHTKIEAKKLVFNAGVIRSRGDRIGRSSDRSKRSVSQPSSSWMLLALP
jgi:hypothetical protein